MSNRVSRNSVQCGIGAAVDSFPPLRVGTLTGLAAWVLHPDEAPQPCTPVALADNSHSMVWITTHEPEHGYRNLDSFLLRTAITRSRCESDVPSPGSWKLCSNWSGPRDDDDNGGMLTCF
jgi:hypothetical protein